MVNVTRPESCEAASPNINTARSPVLPAKQDSAEKMGFFEYLGRSETTEMSGEETHALVKQEAFVVEQNVEEQKERVGKSRQVQGDAVEGKLYVEVAVEALLGVVQRCLWTTAACARAWRTTAVPLSDLTLWEIVDGARRTLDVITLQVHRKMAIGRQLGSSRRRMRARSRTLKTIGLRALHSLGRMTKTYRVSPELSTISLC